MTKAKIFHIRSSYFYGGPERQIDYLSNSLAESGIESAVATFAPKAQPGLNKYYLKLQELNQQAFRIDINSSFNRLPIKELEKLINEGGYNLLVGHDYRADYFVLKLAHVLHLPTVSFSRGWTKKTLKVKVYERLDLRFLKKMDGIIAVSKNKYEELTRRGVDSSRMIYIPNSIMTDNVTDRHNKIRDRFNIPHDAFLIGTAGRLSPEKNQEIFIRAAIKFIEQRSTDSPAPYFIIAGEGVRKEHLAEIIPESLKGRIILAGWIEDNDAFYADIDLFILTSLTEGFPNVLLEAGKYSLPAISTPAGGAVEIIEEEKTGLLFPFDDVATLTAKIKRVIDDSEYGKMLGNGLHQITRGKFDARVNAARFLDFITGIRKRYE
jgi:glycosyltransferase involved in cell wall biosynthesis